MNNDNTLRRAGLAAVVLGAAWCSLPVQADNMSFHGTLIEQAPCTVNGGEDISIEFGDIQIKDIDGVNHSNYFYVYFECEGSPSVTMTHNGVATEFNKAAIQTNVENFGIQLSGIVSGTLYYTPLDIGVPFKLHDKQQGGIINTIFSVVPVKKTGAELAVGAFQGVSTLQLEYQ